MKCLRNFVECHEWIVWNEDVRRKWRWRLRERSERVESPGTCVTECVSRGHFCLALCSFGPPSRALVVITWRGEGCRYMIRSRYTTKGAKRLKIKAQLSSIWAKGCILMTVCVLSDLIWLPLLGVGRCHGILLSLSEQWSFAICDLRKGQKGMNGKYGAGIVGNSYSFRE